MKRTGFLAAIGGAIAAAALPIPKPPAPMFRVTFGATAWRGVIGPVMGRTPTVMLVPPQLLDVAREILGSEYAA